MRARSTEFTTLDALTGHYAEFKCRLREGRGSTVHVRVLAIAGDYVMVRQPGCYPFVGHRGDYVRQSTKQQADAAVGLGKAAKRGDS